MARFVPFAVGLIVFSTAAMADDCQVNARRCGDDGMVQVCTRVAGAAYWTTQDYKCARNGEVREPPVKACAENYRRCGDDGYEEICLADGGTFRWLRMTPALSCR